MSDTECRQKTIPLTIEHSYAQRAIQDRTQALTLPQGGTDKTEPFETHRSISQFIWRFTSQMREAACDSPHEYPWGIHHKSMLWYKTVRERW